MEVSSHHQGREIIMKTKRTWAVAGVSAALILGTAGASYAIPTGSDGTCPNGIEREQLLQERQDNHGGHAGGAYGVGYGDQTQNQVRDQVQDLSGDYARDQVRDQARDQLRDTEDCDGDGPIGDGPLAGDNAGRGGSMGAYGSGR
jgi:hypothetical protein